MRVSTREHGERISNKVTEKESQQVCDRESPTGDSVSTRESGKAAKSASHPIGQVSFAYHVFLSQRIPNNNVT